ncbi:hypothetical protein [Parafrankia sp. BMG5.11]|uniref:hypothetical protein n=1 Tax=Parafrankia sp. BMG5.11 TaxID=222540 RepID=UPI00103A6BDD|nr:hypothetical protein [Parafrankia sp. BMG5.11]TCJ39490.1 hypothetical protein E0504_10300 [Parafrankia sp. BMG5.11]
MGTGEGSSICFVVKAEDVQALNWIDPGYPRPVKLEWINRATDQLLRPTTVNMLLRTLFHNVDTPSVVRLHRSSGLRVLFRSERDRNRFAKMFSAALAEDLAGRCHRVVATFKDSRVAQQAVLALKAAGVPNEAISFLGRLNAFTNLEHDRPAGHTSAEVAGRTLGGGLLGAFVGAAVLSIPGIGPLAIGGAIAASTLSTAATIGGVVGATAGAITKMLKDHDVDGVTAKYYENQIKQGDVLLLVDTHAIQGSGTDILQILRSLGAHAQFINQGRAIGSLVAPQPAPS